MKAHHLTAVTFFLLMLMACVRPNEFTPATSSGLPPGELTRTLTHENRERNYILYVPPTINWDEPVPVVFAFHGGLGNAQNIMRTSGLNEVADQNGFLVGYANGTGRLSHERLLIWNGGNCCAYAQESHVDDVGFVRAIVADMQSLADIDERRIYATGMSNGGILSHRLACEVSDVFAAVAPVAGTLNFPECQPEPPISVIEFHGTDDNHLPYEGGVGSESLVGVDFVSVQESMQFWLMANGCNTQPQTESFDDIEHDVWGDATMLRLWSYTQSMAEDMLGRVVLLVAGKQMLQLIQFLPRSLCGNFLQPILSPSCRMF